MNGRSGIKVRYDKDLEKQCYDLIKLWDQFCSSKMRVTKIQNSEGGERQYYVFAKTPRKQNAIL